MQRFTRYWIVNALDKTARSVSNRRSEAMTAAEAAASDGSRRLVMRCEMYTEIVVKDNKRRKR